MNQKPDKHRFGDFMEGKGFYIALFLCVAAIGISGYFLFSGLFPDEPLSQIPNSQTVTGSAQVEVPPKAPVTPPVTQEPPQEETPTEPQGPEQATIFTWPIRGSVNRDFSLEVFAYDSTMGDWRTHNGLDIAADLGTEVMSVATGTVASISQDPLMGTTVTVDHGDGLTSVYSNLSEATTIQEGDSVFLGSVLGAVGATAIAESADASHLHFEMQQDGISIDPVQFLPQQ